MVRFYQLILRVSMTSSTSLALKHRKNSHIEPLSARYRVHIYITSSQLNKSRVDSKSDVPATFADLLVMACLSSIEVYNRQAHQ